MKGFCLILLLIQTTLSDSEDQFFYQAEDYVQINQNSSLQLQLTLSSKADQYTSEGKLFITILISQNTSLPFNILYFNNQNPNGQQCYQNWIENHQVSVTSPCSLLNSVTEQSMPNCMNYTSCIDQEVTFSLHLSDDLFRQNYIVLQNSNYQMIGLKTEMKVELDSDNWWFYWGVGLTCLLMISLVIFSGVVFYWSLKYKKMKKMFDQFKLTQDSQTVKND